MSSSVIESKTNNTRWMSKTFLHLSQKFNYGTWCSVQHPVRIPPVSYAHCWNLGIGYGSSSGNLLKISWFILLAVVLWNPARLLSVLKRMLLMAVHMLGCWCPTSLWNPLFQASQMLLVLRSCGGVYVPSSMVKERWNMTQTYWWQGVIWMGWRRLDATIESGNIAFVKVIHKHIKSSRDVVADEGHSFVYLVLWEKS